MDGEFSNFVLCNGPGAIRRPNIIYMNIAKRLHPYSRIRYLYRPSPLLTPSREYDSVSRNFAQSTALPPNTSKEDESTSTSKADVQGQENSRMSERLAQITDEFIEQDGRRAKKAIEEGGFSEELKKKLEARLQESSFRSKNAAAFAQVSLLVRLSHQLT